MNGGEAVLVMAIAVVLMKVCVNVEVVVVAVIKGSCMYACICMWWCSSCLFFTVN